MTRSFLRYYEMLYLSHINNKFHNLDFQFLLLKSKALDIKRHTNYNVSVWYLSEIIRKWSFHRSRLSKSLYFVQTLHRTTAAQEKSLQILKHCHECLEHVDFKAIIRTAKSCADSETDLDWEPNRLRTDSVCPSWIKGKAHRLSFPSVSDSNNRSTLDVVHLCFCGPMAAPSLSG